MIVTDTPVTGKIDLTDAERRGVEIARGFSGRPDEHGVLKRFELLVPEFERGCYYAQDKPKSWPAGANRALPYPCKSDFKGLNYGGLFAVLELEGGECLAIVPIAGPLTMTWFEPTAEGGLVLNLGTLGTEPVEADAPLLAWSRSDDVYTACGEAWAEAVGCAPVKGRTVLRHEKDYPEIFRYLGWCSWEEYKHRIDSDLLVGAARRIEKSGLPVRYILVDDGHQIEDGRRLKSFDPHRGKFPDGWKPLLDTRTKDGIRWIGVWHAMQGFWNGLADENDFGEELNSHLAKLPGGAYLPKADAGPLASGSAGARLKAGSSRAFYDALIGSAKRHGFDFVKIDNQASDLQCYQGSANAVQAAATNTQSLGEAVARDMQGLINCMAHNSVCVLNTRNSAVTRCSIDYGVGDATRGKSHIWQSYASALWLGQTVWGDHDMFHSSDPQCGRLMAVSKAMSGAPVYLSDNPDDFVAEYVRPLCYEDGELLRPLAPGAPLPDSVFIDPMKESAPYRVIAPLAGRAAAVVAYNLREAEDEKPLAASVTPADYAHAGGMIQPYEGAWELPPEGLVYYDWYRVASGHSAEDTRRGEGQGGRLEGEYAFELDGFADRLVLLCPVRDGWAVIGRTDKYLSPAAVEVISVSQNEISIRLVESGPFAIWSGAGAPRAEGITFTDAGGGVWKAELHVPEALAAGRQGSGEARGERGVTVTIRR